MAHTQIALAAPTCSTYPPASARGPPYQSPIPACLQSGEVDNWDQSYLDPQETSQGFMLLCSAFPRSDLVITTHQQAPYAVAAKSLK